MTNETKLPDGLQLKEICKALGWQGGTIHQAIGEIKMLRSEYAQRLTLQHHACDQAQRVADLEAERDKLAHDHHLVRADAQARVDAVVIRALAAERERDELRARLNEIEGQEPICAVQMTTTGGRLSYNPDATQLPEHGMPLYARPVPAIPTDPGMLIAGMGSSSTQYVMGWNDCRATALGAFRGDAVAIPDGWKLVKSGALAMVVNALRRDAEDGRPVRGEMADELLAAPEAAR